MTTSTTIIIIITRHLLRIRVAVKNAGQLIFTSKPCCCVLYMNSENACGIRFTRQVSEDICAKLGICRSTLQKYYEKTLLMPRTYKIQQHGFDI